MGKRGIELATAYVTLAVSTDDLAQLVALINKGVLSSKLAKAVFEEMVASGKTPEAIVKEKGLEQISDQGALEAIVDETLVENPKSIEDFRAGKDRALGFLVGQIMKKTKGKANPAMINDLLKEKMK